MTKRTFEEVLRIGLDTGTVTVAQIESIDYDNEIEILDHFDAIEELQSRDIGIDEGDKVLYYNKKVGNYYRPKN